MSRAQYKELGLARYAAAFISFHWGEHPEYLSPLTMRVFWDCFGAPMLIGECGHTSSSFAEWCNVGWAYPRYWCVAMNGHRYGDGGINDIRTLEMIQAGCCPVELGSEIMGADGSPD